MVGHIVDGVTVFGNASPRHKGDEIGGLGLTKEHRVFLLFLIGNGMQVNDTIIESDEELIRV